MLFSLYDFFSCFHVRLFIFFLVSKLEAHFHYIAHYIYFTVMKMANVHKRLLYFFYQVLYVIVVLSVLSKVIWFSWIYLHFAPLPAYGRGMKMANSHSLKDCYISFIRDWMTSRPIHWCLIILQKKHNADNIIYR